MFTTLTQACVHVLETPEAAEKSRLTHAYAKAWAAGEIADIGATFPPDRPARPPNPRLIPPTEAPKRSWGGVKGRIAFVHAIAHIELNAIDLAWDIMARFHTQPLPKAFFDDWVQVAEDEAVHFDLLSQRLAELGAAYGDLDAHDGLWEAAAETAYDPLARLALVPMLLEARGLDTTPKAVARLHSNGDTDTAKIMARIGREEEDHVKAGVRWFEYLCQNRGLDPVPTWKALVQKHFKGTLKPPFDVEARTRAGMDPTYYQTPS